MQQRMQQNQQMIREAKQQQERLTYLQTYLDRSKDRREWFKENTKAADIATDNLRADEELDHTKWKDRAEIFLEHDQQRAVGLD